MSMFQSEANQTQSTSSESPRIIVLALSGEAIQLDDIMISLNMQIKDEDQSGQASSTAKSEQGIKAKELKVSGIVKFKDKENLTKIFELAEAKESNSQMKRYRVACDLAQTVKMREATFSGAVDVAEQSDKNCWTVNFMLKEYVSVAEKKAGQSSGGAGSNTTAIQGAGGASELDEEGNVRQLNLAERILKVIDDKIGPAS